MKKALTIIGLIALMSFAPQQEQKTYTLKFTPEQLQTVYDALGELPAKKVEEIRLSIVRQVNEQNKPSDKK